jgi:hypothetical protein
VGKRIAIISVIILILALAIMWYYLDQGRKNLYTDPYRSIPANAGIVIEAVDIQSFLNSLTTGKGLFGEIGKIKEFDSFNQKLKYFTDQLNKEVVKKILNERAAIFSFHPAIDGKLRILFSMAVSGDIGFRQIKDILHSSGIKEVIGSKLNANTVLKVPFSVNNKRDTTYITLMSGLMVCSNSLSLLEESRSQAENGEDIRNRPGFSRVLLASGKYENKIFVLFANLPEMLKSVLGAKGELIANQFGRLAGTAEGDIYINEEGVVFSGFTESIDSTNFLYRYKFLSPRSFHTYKILPSSTVLFETIILPSINKGGKSDTTITQEALNLAARLREFTGEEITKAYIDIKERPVSDNSLIIYELNNRVQAEQIFLDVLGTKNEILYFEPDDQTRIPVYKTPFKGFTRILLPGFKLDFDELYFAFYDNFLIAGNSYATISKLLYDNLLRKTLSNDINYREFETTLPSRGGYFFYCVPGRITNYLSGFLNEEIITALKLNKTSLNKIQAVGYQLASSNGMIYNSLSIRFKEVVREESNTEWETLLDTIAGIKPFFFTNHITGAKEIFIQDIKNNSYLINAAGRILWKVPLNERIVGNIYMIDYFRNGKYQLLFSGKNYIHLLDRNGNYVERYPIKLRSPATSPLSIFDYDNNLNYRLFIAGEDNRIYSYDKTGNVVKGWKPYTTAGQVKAEISYFNVSGKDYIVAADEKSIYILDRAGNKRVNLKEPVTKAIGSALRVTQGSDPSLVCSAPDGTIQNIYFDGSVDKFSLKKFSIDHSFDFFDIDGNGLGEYIFIDKGILYLYNHNRSEIFARKYSEGDLGGPITFTFSASDRKIGVFDANKKQIYLISSTGETMSGFPLRGASMFSIGKLSDKSGWHLIVGGTDKFLYNYKIDTETK